MNICYIILLFAMPFYTMGDYFSKLYANEPSWENGILSVLMYSITAALWLPAFHNNNNLATFGTTWNISYVICTLLLAFLYFHEPVTAKQTSGIIMGVISIYLLS